MQAILATGGFNSRCFFFYCLWFHTNSGFTVVFTSAGPLLGHTRLDWHSSLSLGSGLCCSLWRVLCWAPGGALYWNALWCDGCECLSHHLQDATLPHLLSTSTDTQQLHAHPEGTKNIVILEDTSPLHSLILISMTGKWSFWSSNTVTSWRPKTELQSVQKTILHWQVYWSF